MSVIGAGILGVGPLAAVGAARTRSLPDRDHLLHQLVLVHAGGPGDPGVLGFPTKLVHGRLAHLALADVRDVGILGSFLVRHNGPPRSRGHVPGLYPRW